MLDLSVCLILKDEAARLPDLLRCLPLPDIEVVAVDTGSSDGTVQILAAAGIRPWVFPWCDDFSAARNAGLARAKRRFLLWLDADDRLDEAFWSGLPAYLDGPKKAYRFSVRSPREDGSCEAFKQIRLFPNHLGARFEGKVHEQLGSSLASLGVPVADADLEITHTGYADPLEREKKRHRNLGLLGQEMREHGRNSAVVMQYGNALCQVGRCAEAREAYLSLLPFRDPAGAEKPPGDECLRHFPALIAESWEQDSRPDQAETWHRLSLAWAPDYLRSRYWLARRELERGALQQALAGIRLLLAETPRIGLVACDNAGVRRNALALGILLATGGRPSAPLPSEARLWLLEALQSGRPALEPKSVVQYLVQGEEWAALQGFLPRLGTASPEDISALEDGAEALLLAGKWLELDGALGAVGETLELSPVLATFSALTAEKKNAGNPGPAMDQFLHVLRRYPEDATAVGQFCDFVNRHGLFDQASRSLRLLPSRGGLLEDIQHQLAALAERDSTRPAPKA